MTAISSQSYGVYAACIAKSKPGDIFEFYVENMYDREHVGPTILNTGITRSATVIGKSEAYGILLGSNDTSLSFWALGNNINSCYELIDNYRDFAFGFWCWPHDVLVAKIIRKR